jgi:hypothetical protein
LSTGSPEEGKADIPKVVLAQCLARHSTSKNSTCLHGSSFNHTALRSAATFHQVPGGRNLGKLPEPIPQKQPFLLKGFTLKSLRKEGRKKDIQPLKILFETHFEK